MKALVLARGLGTRMRRPAEVSLTRDQAAMADQGLKAMVEMARGRPFLDYILTSLADAGVSDVGLVVGPEHEQIRHHYQVEVPPRRLRVQFVIQDEPRGTAHAALAGERFTGDEEFVVVNGDNLYPLSALRSLVTMRGSGLIGYRRAGLIAGGNIPADRIASFAIIWTGRDGALTGIVEKPDAEQSAASDLVSMNSWRFTPEIFASCKAIGPSPRGELELQDAVTHAMTALGVRFQVVESNEGVLDLSTRADIELVAKRLERFEVAL